VVRLAPPADTSRAVRLGVSAGSRAGGQGRRGGCRRRLQVPGLLVAAPSTPTDVKGLFRTAGAIPFGQGVVRRPGSDVTVVAVARMVHQALAAAERLAAEGVSVEVIDLRTLVPMDVDLVAESVARTHRLVVAHEVEALFFMLVIGVSHRFSVAFGVEASCPMPATQLAGRPPSPPAPGGSSR
jgi:2-oxoisovalerate dehydrogenase E1 component